MIVGIPVLNRPEITDLCLAQLEKSSAISIIRVIDNASDEPYQSKDFGVTRNLFNAGFYWPIQQLHESYPDLEIVAVMHNDLLVYEPGWDKRIVKAFEDDPKLAVLGVCGSNEVDRLGGRGGGTMCNFRGKWQLQEHTGKEIFDVHASAILDSMFMAFRNDIVDELGIDMNITPAHFYDKILPMRAIRLGYHVATIGIEVDHMGGTTLVAEPRYEQDMRAWCDEHGVAYENDAGTAVYLEAERRWLTEFKDDIPGFVDDRYQYHTY